MDILIPIISVVTGLAILIFSGDRLIQGAVEVAMRFKVSPLFIGITVVAAGTSLPELLVSLIAQYEDKSGLSIGNVIGSNIFNIGLVLGSVLIWTRKITTTPGATEIFGLLLGTIALTMYLIFNADADGVTVLNASAGILLVLSFLILLVMMLKSGKKNPATEEVEQLAKGSGSLSIAISLLVGIVGLWLGAKLLVTGAISLAELLGISDTIIGLTLVAAGTGAPELFATIAAIRKGSSAMAIGNVVGSNLFNTVAIVGVAALVRPLEVDLGVLKGDLMTNLGLTVIICILVIPGLSSRSRTTIGTLILLTYLFWLGSIIF
ncbi:MAG: calcium/sodium antiporter [Planctomycetes bacterium]|nr:calcium/sodium antiporter [Planctomycetota bacterium]MBT6969132.1 calcium/sodium antiporter [Planctomycetota bacterium]MBT7639723.1 calcium/sodium antiporter [Planctomycetota bacterium]